MNFDQPQGDVELRDKRNREIISLAVELSRKQEGFSFFGIDQESYSRIKIAEEEYPCYTLPIDEFIVRCQNEGIKVVLGDYPESGNVFVLPKNSCNIGSDSISPRHLQIVQTMDESLKRLILEDRARNNRS